MKVMTQKGSGAITVLVTVVIVAIIAWVGYVAFYEGKKDADNDGGFKIELGGGSN